MNNQKVDDDFRWAVRGAVSCDVKDSVVKNVDGAVWGAVSGAVAGAVAGAVVDAVDQAVAGAMWQDLAHPELQDFLLSAGANTGVS